MKLPDFRWCGAPSNGARPIQLPPQGVNPLVDVMYRPANEPAFKVVLKPA